MRNFQIYIFILANVLCFRSALFAQELPLSGIRAVGSPHQPKVPMTWNRYHTLDEVYAFANALQKAYPQFVQVEMIGKSYEKRDIIAIKIHNNATGSMLDKPAFYIQGNIHANELQGTEISMYTAWYLCENYAFVPFIKELVDQKVFYILPTINPDGHYDFMYRANHASSPRSGAIPMDDDGDWEIDEDGMNDLNQDGHITMMRRKTKLGKWKEDPEYPTRMVMVKPGEEGEYEMLGYEGFDQDGDGKVNEDRLGYYDPNRDWGYNWQPDYIQGGAYRYPFSTPENQAVRKFILAHPNIAGAQSYHNYGGMFLRGPGAEEDLGLYSREDNQVYDLIGKIGEKVVPGYRYLVTYKDLYSVFGGDLDFFHGCLGVYGFVNEIMTSYLLFHRKSETDRWNDNQFQEFDKYLLFGDAYVPWTPYKHPQFGDIEIGGPKKNYIRNTPGFLMEEDAHRNMAFTIFHAYQTPQIEFDSFSVRDMGNGLKEISLTVKNTRAIPTHSAHDVKNKLQKPVTISIQSDQVVAGFVMENTDFGLGTEQIFDPANLLISSIRGNDHVKVKWLVKDKKDSFTITVQSSKGGKQQKNFPMQSLSSKKSQ
jgi:hypothetical protein